MHISARDADPASLAPTAQSIMQPEVEAEAAGFVLLPKEGTAGARPATATTDGMDRGELVARTQAATMIQMAEELESAAQKIRRRAASLVAPWDQGRDQAYSPCDSGKEEEEEEEEEEEKEKEEEKDPLGALPRFFVIDALDLIDAHSFKARYRLRECLRDSGAERAKVPGICSYSAECIVEYIVPLVLAHNDVGRRTRIAQGLAEVRNLAAARDEIARCRSSSSASSGDGPAANLLDALLALGVEACAAVSSDRSVTRAAHPVPRVPPSARIPRALAIELGVLVESWVSGDTDERLKTLFEHARIPRARVMEVGDSTGWTKRVVECIASLYVYDHDETARRELREGFARVRASLQASRDRQKEGRTDAQPGSSYAITALESPARLDALLARVDEALSADIKPLEDASDSGSKPIDMEYVD